MWTLKSLGVENDRKTERKGIYCLQISCKVIGRQVPNRKVVILFLKAINTKQGKHEVEKEAYHLSEFK